MERRPLSKRTRFEVFKRDAFTCVYCGSHPPTVVLEVGHIIPVAEGGDDSFGNLVTACSACNSGKSAVPLTEKPPTIGELHSAAVVREEQIVAYEEFLHQRAARIAAHVDEVAAIFEQRHSGRTLTEQARRQVARFLDQLPVTEVAGAAHLACDRDDVESPFLYFCGICWNKIRRGNDGAY